MLRMGGQSEQGTRVRGFLYRVFRRESCLCLSILAIKLLSLKTSARDSVGT